MFVFDILYIRFGVSTILVDSGEAKAKLFFLRSQKMGNVTKESDPVLYAHMFKEGVERADAGASTPISDANHFLGRADCYQAITDGYCARLAMKGSDDK